MGLDSAANLLCLHLQMIFYFMEEKHEIQTVSRIQLYVHESEGSRTYTFLHIYLEINRPLSPCN